jgi:hypothetical protein
MFWSSNGQVHHGFQLPSMTTFLNSNAHDIAITNCPSLTSILKLDVMTNRNKFSLLHMFTPTKYEVQWCVANDTRRASIHSAHTITSNKHLSTNTWTPIMVWRKQTCFQIEQPFGPSNANGWWQCHFRVEEDGWRKNRLVLITNSSFEEWNYVELLVHCSKLDLVAFDLMVHQDYIEFLCGTCCKLV